MSKTVQNEQINKIDESIHTQSILESVLEEEVYQVNKESTSLPRKILGLLSVIFKIIAAVFVFGMILLYILTRLGISEITSALIASQLSILILGLSFCDFRIKKMFSELRKKINGEVIFQSLKITMFVLIINTILGFFMEDNDKTSETVDILINDVSFFMSIFLPVIIAPLFEELTFRSGLKYVLIDKYGFSKIAYVIIGGTIFGLMHYSPGSLGVIHVILTGAMGILYSICYLKTNNIYVSMISHFLYNGLIMIVAHIA